MPGRFSRLCLVALLILSGLSYSQVSASEKTIIQFSKPDCRACQDLFPTLRKLLGQGFRIRIINVEVDRVTVERFRVQRTPTFRDRPHSLE